MSLVALVAIKTIVALALGLTAIVLLVWLIDEGENHGVDGCLGSIILFFIVGFGGFLAVATALFNL